VSVQAIEGANTMCSFPSDTAVLLCCSKFIIYWRSFWWHFHE